MSAAKEESGCTHDSSREDAGSGSAAVEWKAKTGECIGAFATPSPIALALFADDTAAVHTTSCQKTN